MQPNEQVQFEEQASNNFASKAKMPSLNNLVVKMGLAKDYNGSNMVLVIIAIVAAVLAIGIYVFYVQGYNPFVSKTSDNGFSKLPVEVQKALQKKN